MDITSPSATSGREAARRSIAPSISTCSAPCASIASADLAHLLGGARAGDFDGAGALQPDDQHAAEGSADIRLLEQLERQAARAQQAVGAREQALGGQAHAGLVDAEVDHVVLLAVAPDRSDADSAPGPLQLPQQRRERLRLARVLGQSHESQALVPGP